MSMVAGFMAGVALGQKIVGMNKSKKTQIPSQAQRLQLAKIAAYKRMQARQNQIATSNFSMNLPALPNFDGTNMQPRRGGGGRNSGNGRSNLNAEEIVFEDGFAKEFRNTFKDDASGQLLNSIRNSFSEFNAWVKKQTGGLLDLNMSLAIFFIIRGIRRIILEKQYPNAWQMIWWASSILRGWRFV